MRSCTKLISPNHPSLNLSHPTPDSFVWNTIIRSHLHPISVYRRMLLHRARPDTYTYPFLLSPLSSLLPGRQLHAHILLSGLSTHSFIQTSLITMYSNCTALPEARQLFDEIPHPDLASSNSILFAYLKHNSPNSARQLFDSLSHRNVITWSCMIDGLAKCGDSRGALRLFRDMQREATVRPNQFTVSSVLVACGRLGALEHGKWVHSYIERCTMTVDTVLGTSLIDMYAKCGSIERARHVFDQLGDGRDVTAWSAMISGLAMHGLPEECLGLFEKMLREAMEPNAVTFLGVLCACVHGGLVREGARYFAQMSEEFSINPSIQHYGCIVDLYARAGLIGKARDVVSSMPMKPDVLVWGALLSGSRMHGDIETCESSIKELIQLDPMNSGAYVLLSNLYAKMGRWADARQVRNLMEEMGIKKTPGCSMVEIDGRLHEFLVGDRSHPEEREIYRMLEEMMERLKLEGYVPNTKEVLLDLDEREKEFALFIHSEKLAVAFCFIKTRPGTTIHIIKNLRICVDCHSAIKLMSKVYDREIVVRDCSRFHRFHDGVCSCKDYW